MPRKPATEDERRQVRVRLQRAAADVYRKEGLSGVSARAIATAAGVSVGTLYAYFGSLPALMQTLWQEPLETLNQRFLALAESIKDPIERLEALLDMYLEFALERPELYRGAFLFVRPQKLEQPERQALHTEVFPDLLLQAIEEAQATGHLTGGDAATIAQLLWSGLHGCLALPVNMDRFAFLEVRVVAKQMIQRLLASLKA